MRRRGRMHRGSMLGVDMTSLMWFFFWGGGGGGGERNWRCGAVCGACELSTTLEYGREGRSWTRVTE